MTASIFSIVYQPKDQKYDERLDYFIREPLTQATLLANHGIAGDDKAGRNPRRQINVLSYDWLMKRKREGYKTNPGDFGEQLIIRGLDVDKLVGKTRLQLGDTAVVEVTFPRVGCIRLDAAQGVSEVFVGKPIGMMLRVVNGGAIQVGDSVSIL